MGLGGVPDPGRVRDTDDLVASESGVGECLDLRGRRTVAALRRDGLKDVAAGERGAALIERVDVDLGGELARAQVVGEQPGEPRLVEAVLGRAGAPLVAQPVDRHLVVLALACRQRRGLGGQEGVPATPSQLADDLGAAPGEVLDQLAGEAGEVGRPLGHLAPLEPEVPADLVAQARLVDESRRLGALVERSRVQRCPAAVRPLGAIGDHDVGVQQRIAGPRGSMTKARGEKPVAAHNFHAVLATSRPARLALEVGDCVGDRLLVAATEDISDVGRRDAGDDAHALGSLERQVEPGNAALGQRPPEQCSGRRDRSLEQPTHLPRADVAREPERAGTSAEPPPGRFAFAAVVVLAPERDRFLVVPVRIRACSELADREHP